MLDLCDRLLDLNPEMRPTTQQIFFHPFLRNMLPTNQLVEIDVLKKCELPLLNMVMRNVECLCLFDEMEGNGVLLGYSGWEWEVDIFVEWEMSRMMAWGCSRL